MEEEKAEAIAGQMDALATMLSVLIGTLPHKEAMKTLVRLRALHDVEKERVGEHGEQGPKEAARAAVTEAFLDAIRARCVQSQ